MNQFLADLRQFLPSERIYTDELRTLGWGTDASFYRQIPKAVIRSDGEEEISRIVQLCKKHKLPFTFALWSELYGLRAHRGGQALGKIYAFP